MKKLISLLLTAALLGGVFAGCGGGQKEDKKDSAKSESVLEKPAAAASADKYRNYYEIFTQSFADSDNDGTGDLQGIIDRLDYLNDGNPEGGDDLGVDGLWLTPIFPSESYHKYNVEDYYNVDSSFGSLETFDKLVEECHKRGINIILDLVLNHISYKNPLFVSACDEVKQGKLDGKARLFEFHKPDYYSPEVNVIEVGDYVCEANFSPTMPEWNLDSEETRQEFTNIAKFWLDRGVDGFRLDAVKYFTNNHTDGTEFLQWFVETCRRIKPEAYLVGEDWSDDSEIQTFYGSGIDSLFAFRFAQGSGEIAQSIATGEGQKLGKKFANYDKKMVGANSDYINATFLSNHDQVRIANALESHGIASEKLAANLYMLLPGNSFIYYGEEIGMKSENTDADRWHRLPMVFDSDHPQAITVEGASAQTTPTGGGVKQQLADKNSLLNHYRTLIDFKLRYPALARGRITAQTVFDDAAIAAYTVASGDQTFLVVHNLSESDAATAKITDEVLPGAKPAAVFAGDVDGEQPSLADGTLTLPACSSAVLLSAG